MLEVDLSILTTKIHLKTQKKAGKIALSLYSKTVSRRKTFLSTHGKKYEKYSESEMSVYQIRLPSSIVWCGSCLIVVQSGTAFPTVLCV